MNDDEINYKIDILAEENRPIYCSRFSVSETKILYAVNSAPNLRIYALDIDGSNKKLLIDSIGYTDSAPIVSEHGQKFAFVHRIPVQSTTDIDVFLKIAYINETKPKTLFAVYESLFAIQFSPDTSLILFNWHHQISLSSYGNSIYTIKTDGTNMKQISGNDNAIPVSFVPFSDRILGESDWDGSGFIYTLDLNGENMENVTVESSKFSAVSYSPDGNNLLCISQQETNNGDINREIYIIQNDGSSQKRLTNNLFQDYPVAFSSDGQKILFYSNRDTKKDDDWEIYTMRTDGSKLKRLTANSTYDMPICFINNDTQILFISKNNGKYKLKILNLI